MEHLENFQPNDNFSFRDNLRVTDAVIQSITTNRGTTFVTIEYDDCSSCRSKTQITRNRRGLLPANPNHAFSVHSRPFGKTHRRLRRSIVLHLGFQMF